MDKVYLVICILCWSFLAIFYKLAIDKLNPLSMQIISCGFGTTLIPFYFHLLKQQNNFVWNKIGIIYGLIGAILSAGGSLVYMYALRKYEVGYVVGITSAYPLITFLLSSIIFSEELNLKKVIAMVMILFGVWLLHSGVK